MDNLMCFKEDIIVFNIKNENIYFWKKIKNFSNNFESNNK